jgi:hypothetical protein
VFDECYGAIQIASGARGGFLLVTPDDELAVEAMRNVATRVIDLRKKIEAAGNVLES